MQIIKVKIKTWDEMANQYGILPTGLGHNIIPIESFVFSEGLEKLMPSDRSIEVYPSSDFRCYYWRVGDDYWSISRGMIDQYLTGKGLLNVKI